MRLFIILLIAANRTTIRRLRPSVMHFNDYLQGQLDSIDDIIQSNQKIIQAGDLQSQILEELDELHANNTRLWIKRNRTEQECHKLLAVSPSPYIGHLYDELDVISAQIESNNQRIRQLQSLLMSQSTDDLDRLQTNNTALLEKKKEIEHGLHELMAISEAESPNFRSLIASCRGLDNKALPSDIIRLILLNEKERMYQEHVQFIVDHTFPSDDEYYSEKPIHSLKNIIFPVLPDDCE